MSSDSFAEGILSENSVQTIVRKKGPNKLQFILTDNPWKRSRRDDIPFLHLLNSFDLSCVQFALTGNWWDSLDSKVASTCLHATPFAVYSLITGRTIETTFSARRFLDRVNYRQYEIDQGERNHLDIDPMEFGPIGVLKRLRRVVRYL
jgi:hypothetical protein